MANNVFLPLVMGSGRQEHEFFKLLKSNSQQRRSKLEWEGCLTEAARLRVLQASREFSHCFQGDCVNRIVRKMCYLPAEYSENGNSIESLVGGVEDPVKALGFLLDSPAHADHLLGRNSFFLEQSRAGVGFARVEESKYRFYYCVLISK